MFYHDYKFEMIPTIIGALGYVPNDLKTNLEKLSFNEEEIVNITRKLQTISVSGTVKIVKPRLLLTILLILVLALFLVLLFTFYF